jgi:integrase
MAKLRKPTAKIVLRKERTLKNGEHPIAIRIMYNRKPRYYVLKDESKTITCTANKWDSKYGRFNKNSDLNIVLQTYENKAYSVFKELEISPFTFSKFEEKFFSSREQKKVEGFFDDQISGLKKDNKLGTAAVYSDTKNRVNEFVNNRQIVFQDVDEKFLRRFENHLLNKGNSVNSVSIYLRTFRALVNQAIRKGYLDEKDYPFKYFTIKTGQTIKRALTKEAMKKLMGYKAANGTRMDRSLDYFVFSYLTRGMNMKDMANLRWKKNIVGERIVYVRAKTSSTESVQKQHVVKIEPPIRRILNKYSKRMTYVFPILEEGLTASAEKYRIKATLKRLSKDITAIGNELKIPEANDITFYWARHTYATVLKRSGVATAVISEALGHSSEKTTQAYLDSFDTETMDSTFEHLI